MRFTCLPAVFVLGVSVLLRAAPPGSPAKPGTLRILNAADDPPPRYRKTAQGRISAIIPGFEETPPDTLYLKKGNAYTPLRTPPDGLSHPVPAPGEPGAGFFVKKHAGGDTENELAKLGRAGDAAPGAKSAAPKDEWAPVAAPPPPDGADRLLCLYQPDTKKNWYPPRSLVLDVSPKVFPAGRVLVVNLSPSPVFFQLGAKSPAGALESGKVALAPAFDASGEPFSARVAVRNAGGAIVNLFNTGKTLAPEKRAILFVRAADVRNSRSGLFVRFVELPEPDKPAGVASR